MTGSAYTYTVYVDDNFHYMDEEERYKLGDFAALEEAIAACKRVVDTFLEDETTGAAPARERYRQYTSFGPDPFVKTDDPDAKQPLFSAWNYAEKRCLEGEEQGRETGDLGT
jgi:hypothetical protein